MEEQERRKKEFEERTNLFQEALDVDEVIAQLLVTEGFATVEEIAFVDSTEVSNIEGFDENFATEIQTRAKEYLERKEAELDEKRKALGVKDELSQVPGVTTAMLVAFGEGGVKTVEDLADCATDDLIGWSEKVSGENKRHPGILDSFSLSKTEAEDLVMSARVVAGWVLLEDVIKTRPAAAEAEIAPAEKPKSEAEALFADLKSDRSGKAGVTGHGS